MSENFLNAFLYGQMEVFFLMSSGKPSLFLFQRDSPVEFGSFSITANQRTWLAIPSARDLDEDVGNWGMKSRMGFQRVVSRRDPKSYSRTLYRSFYLHYLSDFSGQKHNVPSICPCAHIVDLAAVCPLQQWSPTFLPPGTGFVRQFFHRLRRGDGFRMSQVHYIYCPLYFYYYHTVIYNEVHSSPSFPTRWQGSDMSCKQLVYYGLCAGRSVDDLCLQLLHSASITAPAPPRIIRH